MDCVLRSFDIVVALARVRGEDMGWSPLETADLLLATEEEYLDSLHRLARARLIRSDDGHGVLRETLLGFLEHGVPHVFPGSVGPVATGVETGGGARFLGPAAPLLGNELVWESRIRGATGRRVDPLDPRVPAIAVGDEMMHALLAAADLFRVGRARGRRLARLFLEQVLLRPGAPLFVVDDMDATRLRR